MKSTTRHIALTFLLCFTVLFSSVGMTLQEHFCMMSGEPVAAINTDCCTKKESDTNTESENEKCCKLHIEHQKLEPVSQVKTFSLTLPVFFISPVTYLFIPNQIAELNSESRLYYTDSSPPLAGRDLLNYLQILIV